MSYGTGSKKAVNAMCFGVMICLGVYLSVFQRVLDVIAADFSLNRTATGLVVTAHFTGLLIGPLVSGELSDRFGRKTVITGGLVLFTAGLVMVFSSSLFLLIAAGILVIGMGFGVLEGAVATLLTDVAASDINRVMNVSQIFFSIGTVAGPFIAVGIIVATGSWKLLYGAGILFGLFFLIIFIRYPYPDCRISEKIEGTITMKLLTKKGFIVLCLSMIMYVGVEEGIAFWITTYAKEWDTSQYYATLMLSLFWGSMIIGRYIMSRFSKRLSELIVAGSIFSAVFLTAGLFTKSLAANLAAFFLTGLGFSGIWPMIMAVTKTRYPRYTGTAFGIMMACCAAGGIVIPLVMGYIADTSGLKAALAFCLAPITVIVLSHLYLIRGGRSEK